MTRKERRDLVKSLNKKDNELRAKIMTLLRNVPSKEQAAYEITKLVSAELLAIRNILWSSFMEKFQAHERFMDQAFNELIRKTDRELEMVREDDGNEGEEWKQGNSND